MCVGNALIKQEYGNYISCFWVHPIFRSFRKIKKKTALSFVMQVCLSARSSVCLSVANLLPMQGFSENISRKFKVNYNMSIKRDTLKEDPCKFMTISCWILLWIINFWDTRWFKYDRDWFVCKQAALRSSCATLREWSHNFHPPSCSG